MQKSKEGVLEKKKKKNQEGGFSIVINQNNGST